jgi:hypothetical protein|tara:strand:+ start:188 stop:535 length:348 start_codon:yes stop_codon:yes gene_type:complete
MAKFSAAEIRKLKRQLKGLQKTIDPKQIKKLLAAGTKVPTFTTKGGFKSGGLAAATAKLKAQGLKKGGSPDKKISKVMREFKNKKLNIGKSKKKVKSRKQALAIALNQAGISKKT